MNVNNKQNVLINTAIALFLARHRLRIINVQSERKRRQSNENNAVFTDLRDFIDTIIASQAFLCVIGQLFDSTGKKYTETMYTLKRIPQFYNAPG